MNDRWQDLMEEGLNRFAEGDVPAAIVKLREGVAEAGTDQDRLAVSNTNLGRALFAAGDLDGAEKAFKHAMAAWHNTPSADGHGTGLAVFGLAQIALERGDLQMAVLHCRHAIQLYSETVGADHPDTAAAINLTGYITMLRGDIAGAEPLIKSALRIFERHFGSEHPDTIQTREFYRQILEELRRAE